MANSREGRSGSRSRSRSPRRNRSRSLSRSRARSRSRSRDSGDSGNPGNNLYVTGLSLRVASSDLEKYFSHEGKVLECHIVMDPHTRESRGFGFVTMETVEDADRCIKYLNRSVFEGRLITVEKAKRKRGRTPTPGKYRGAREKKDAIEGGPAAIRLTDGERGDVRVRAQEVIGTGPVRPTRGGVGIGHYRLVAGATTILISMQKSNPNSIHAFISNTFGFLTGDSPLPSRNQTASLYATNILPLRILVCLYHL